ncbi:MAG: hypothetical protein J7L15_06360 [Clostridiales bacterium]|nr:hypothetical protein [Clostridiales bacterium]
MTTQTTQTTQTDIKHKTLKLSIAALMLATLSGLTGCNELSQETKDKHAVQAQQGQYAKAQPVPAYNFSLERDLLIKLYNLRNQKVSTHTVWRSDYGIVEGECTSMGYGLPYDTSLTNPLQPTGSRAYSITSIGQAEPNGVFASTNTSATWVMCLGAAGNIEPHYVEGKVTVYPYPVKIDWNKNRVQRAEGTKSITLD